MIDIRMRVVYRGEKHDVADFKASDLVAFEHHFDVSLPRLGGLNFEQACYLVWRVLRRRGVIGGDVAFDDGFLDYLDNMEQVEDPFPAPTDDPSPS